MRSIPNALFRLKQYFLEFDVRISKNYNNNLLSTVPVRHFQSAHCACVLTALIVKLICCFHNVLLITK